MLHPSQHSVTDLFRSPTCFARRPTFLSGCLLMGCHYTHPRPPPRAVRRCGGHQLPVCDRPRGMERCHKSEDGGRAPGGPGRRAGPGGGRAFTHCSLVAYSLPLHPPYSLPIPLSPPSHSIPIRNRRRLLYLLRLIADHGDWCETLAGGAGVPRGAGGAGRAGRAM